MEHARNFDEQNYYDKYRIGYIGKTLREKGM